MTDLSMVDLLYVLETLQNCGTRVKRTARTRGGNYNGLCPLCGDRNGLYVLPEALNEQGQREGKWACRTCHPKESDAVGMLVHYDKLTYAQAFSRLRELYPDLPHSSNYKTGSKAKNAQPQPVRIKPLAENAVPPSQEWQARANRVLMASQKWLWSEQGSEARQYLFARGLTEKTIKDAGLGFLWLDEGRTAIREKPALWGLDPEQYEDGIYLPSGIVIPYFYKGEIWKLRIRRLGDNIPQKDRYSMVSGGSNGLYNADDIQPGQPAIKLEGEFDALSVKQAMQNTIACVATGGTTQARIPLWLSKLALASTVLICFDNDKKSETTADAIRYWKDRLSHSKVYSMPAGYKDANDMLCMKGEGDVRGWVLAGLDKDAMPLVAPRQAEPEAAPVHANSLQGNEHKQKPLFSYPELVNRVESLQKLGMSFAVNHGHVVVDAPFDLSRNIHAFIQAHEALIARWLQGPYYASAKVFYQKFCAQPGYHLRLNDAGQVAIGVPEALSDEEFERIAEQVCAQGNVLRQVLRDVSLPVTGTGDLIEVA